MFRYDTIMKTKKMTHNGFTLIELIVTLAILGLILAISVPNYMTVRSKSELRADLVTVGMIEKSEGHYLTMNQRHSFDESAEQSASNFHDSLDNLASLIDPVEFYVLTNVHWAKEDNHWYIAYDMISPRGDENADEDEVLPDHPEWDPNQNHYNGGDRVIYQGRVFEARYWTSSVPGLFDSHWDEITDEWRSFNIYHGGDTVEYNGHTYIAKNDTPGSTVVWAFIE